ncbi:glycoside hydrolase family 28 protein, partial [Vibrio sp. PP-XX7]
WVFNRFRIYRETLSRFRAPLHPAGKTFVTGALFLKSNMTFEIQKGAILKGSTNAEDYPLEKGYQIYSYQTNDTDSRRPPSLLNVLSADHRNGTKDELTGYDDRRGVFQNIRVVGEGTLDGSGWLRSETDTKDEAGKTLAYFANSGRSSVFDQGKLAANQLMAAWKSYDDSWSTKAELLQLIEDKYNGLDSAPNTDLYSNRRSSLTTFRGVNNLYFGGLHLSNPALHGVMFLESENVVFAYTNTQTFDINNADGVEFGNSKNSVVLANFIDSGDDCINFAAGQGAAYTTGQEPSEKSWIINNYTREGHGAVVAGSHTGAWIQDILAEDNVSFLTDRGLRLKSTTTTGGGARRIVFRDNALKNIGTKNSLEVNGVTIKNRGGTGETLWRH